MRCQRRGKTPFPSFLQGSLDSLVSATPKESLKITSTISKGSNLLYKKGIYPYEYMDSWERLSETRLPDKEKFSSKLNDKHITDEEYAHVQTVWEAFECKMLGDCHDLYVKTDVALLADVFENFRNLCQEQYGLDPAHYYTSPGLFWDALLKKTGVELELFTDLEMHLRGKGNALRNLHGKQEVRQSKQPASTRL